MNDTDKMIEIAFKDYIFQEYPFTEEEYQLMKDDSLSALRFKAGALWALEYVKKSSVSTTDKMIQGES